MRAVVQRVTRAEVRVGCVTVSRIGPGLLVLVGIGRGDTPESGEWLAEKIVSLRILDDEQGKMNRSLVESGGSVLCVSQFTLYGDCRKGRRPSYAEAAPSEVARPLYEAFLQSLRSRLPAGRVESGEFQSMMEVELVNDGPVTLLLDSEKQF
ncbi:MAG TPA: D-aminoacyl-tRNA deacylase [Terriglobia bacterium]|nr:D-aminoacyl-tRNA deacylase [Terriglobia bacterium]